MRAHVHTDINNLPVFVEANISVTFYSILIIRKSRRRRRVSREGRRPELKREMSSELLIHPVLQVCYIITAVDSFVVNSGKFYVFSRTAGTAQDIKNQ